MYTTNLIILALLVVCFGLSGSEARAIDDIDNSIEATGVKQPVPASMFLLPRSRFGTEWLRFTITPPAKIVQRLGSNVEIPCEVMGSQIPTVQWIVGEMPLSEIESVESNVITESSAIATVKVHSVHIIDHILSEARTYTCVARTGSKTEYVSTVVYPPANLKDILQQEEPFTGPVMPRIVYSERMHLELMGSNIMLPCKVHARPDAEVTWVNEENVQIVQNQRYKILPTGDLLITNLKWEDMGSYRCVARNALGQDEAQVFVYPVKKDNN